jgi:hypothetical protein
MEADEGPTTPCEIYCEDLLLVCPEEPTTMGGCIETCLGFPDAATTPQFGVRSGNSLSCRTSYLNDAFSDPLACDSAGLSGGDACIDPCERYCRDIVDCPDADAMLGGEDCETAQKPTCHQRRSRASCRSEALANAENAPESACRRGAFESCYCDSAGVQDSCLGDPTICETALDTLDDCGNCGSVCPSGSRCLANVCRAACEGILCEGVCHNPLIDPTLCGATHCGDGLIRAGTCFATALEPAPSSVSRA